MIYVSASLDNAQKRNEMRARKLPPEIVKADWEKAQKNANGYKSMFKRDFIEVKNDDDIKSLDNKAGKLYGKLMTWSSQFPGNKLATAWKEQELISKKR
jgi:predicted kinase